MDVAVEGRKQVKTGEEVMEQRLKKILITTADTKQ